MRAAHSRSSSNQCFFFLVAHVEAHALCAMHRVVLPYTWCLVRTGTYRFAHLLVNSASSFCIAYTLTSLPYYSLSSSSYTAVYAYARVGPRCRLHEMHHTLATLPVRRYATLGHGFNIQPKNMPKQKRPQLRAKTFCECQDQGRDTCIPEQVCLSSRHSLGLTWVVCLEIDEGHLYSFRARGD